MKRFGYEVRLITYEDGRWSKKSYYETLATDYQTFSRVKAERIAKQANREQQKHRYLSVKYVAIKY